MCLKEVGLRLSALITTLHSIANAVWRICVSSFEHALSILTVITSRDIRFSIQFVVELLMQHEFCCVNLINRSWGT